ncbi:hypothetical protein HYALB_00008560 [Hymenoscyphus albidus]|uniref:Heterokaryon incompatibility domain-containing protein n=1 Tax=Hymenoscyphus albidus TaxID=595503 RepID=A0A9N9Q558_9HELO|nr:hypothetical protein HYALB_00008560 [Hymenoscyphus albidus]
MAELAQDPSSNESWKFVAPLDGGAYVLGPQTPLSDISAGPGSICAVCVKVFQGYRDFLAFTEKNPIEHLVAACAKMIIKFSEIIKQATHLTVAIYSKYIGISAEPPFGPHFSFSIYSTETETSTMKRLVEIQEEKSNGSIRGSTLSQSRSWLSQCLQHHENCASSHTSLLLPKRLPTRLLKIKKEEDVYSVCVVETSSLSPKTDYVTLSHRWGTSRHITLTSTTYTGFLRDLPWRELPKTFVDAIELIVLLQFNYIWIDSLCIIQDSNHDWVKEASMMAQVYSFCILNISADAAIDDDGGLFQQHYENFCVTGFKSNGKHRNFVWHSDGMWEENIEAECIGVKASELGLRG